MILEWLALTLFRATTRTDDESAQHSIFTIESEHPYRANSNIVQNVFIPGASKIIVQFDPLSKTEPATVLIAFYLINYVDVGLINILPR